jgi:signal transduction histidine kinase
MDPMLGRLSADVDRHSRYFAERRFPELARALHAAVPATVRRWRSQSLAVMPYLDALSRAGFENSIATTLHLLANALECDDPERLWKLMEESPEHGLLRFVQQLGPQTLLAEERILRSSVVTELRLELGRVPTIDEDAALHDLLSMMGEFSLLAMIGKRGEARDREIQVRISGLHRLADLGTLVAGVAHDASNMFLPLRMRLEHLMDANLPPDLREDLVSIELMVRQFQNSIVNLRWLSVDSTQGRASSPTPRAGISLSLHEWAADIHLFHQKMLPPSVKLQIEVPPSLPRAGISSAALSQATFNLIHNASQAIASQREGASGVITIRAEEAPEGRMRVIVEDDGPGMSEEVLRRSAEPFFTTRANGSGLGLALVRALVEECGGNVRIISPPPGMAKGTAVVMTIPVAVAS